jgi:hypothetical protein
VLAELLTPVAIVAHDAGGAELLSSYVARNDVPCRFVLEGPAVQIFQRKLGLVARVSLTDALATCNSFLTGTSRTSELEWLAIKEAKTAKKFTATFLDHWVNYQMRFIRGKQECLPNEIWVGDVVAQELASKTFLKTFVRLMPNPYFDDIREQFLEIANVPRSRSKGGLSVLFLCTPIDPSEDLGYTEFEALHYFYSNRQVLGVPISNLVLRPHPSESSGKYVNVIKDLGSEVKLGGAAPLLQEIAESDVVVGCESMAMVVALIVGRRVISAIPPGGRATKLPHPGIESLQLVASRV